MAGLNGLGTGNAFGSPGGAWASWGPHIPPRLTVLGAGTARNGPHGGGTAQAPMTCRAGRRSHRGTILGTPDPHLTRPRERMSRPCTLRHEPYHRRDPCLKSEPHRPTGKGPPGRNPEGPQGGRRDQPQTPRGPTGMERAVGAQRTVAGKRAEARQRPGGQGASRERRVNRWPRSEPNQLRGPQDQERAVEVESTGKGQSEPEMLGSRNTREADFRADLSRSRGGSRKALVRGTENRPPGPKWSRSAGETRLYRASRSRGAPQGAVLRKRAGLTE